MLADEAIAGLVSTSGVPLEGLFLAGYLLSLLLIFVAIAAIGRGVYITPWLTVALAAAFALRHRIPRTSANSFEPYFHPRMLAFGLGALAIAAVLRRRFPLAIVLVAGAAVVHVTTALWFAVLLGIAIAILDDTFRRLVVTGAVFASAALVWALAAGPLRGSLGTMDGTWLMAVSGKDSLFASEWPLWAWIANLGLVVLAWTAYSGRSRPEPSNDRSAALRALIWGATALLVLFLATFPLVLARLALPVQLQIARVFWLVDFVALICVLSLVRREQTAKVVALVLVTIAAARGVYVLAVEHPERPLFAVGLPASDWQEAMRWIKAQPIDVHVLADPGHAWKYGTSVRVSAERDVFQEDVKDSAVAIYSRDTALRYVERAPLVADFDTLSVDQLRSLASRYDLDFLVTEADVALPLAYRNRRFRIYSLK